MLPHFAIDERLNHSVQQEVDELVHSLTPVARKSDLMTL
jgi:hypothetical protein